MSDPLEYLLMLARAGSHSDATPCERQASDVVGFLAGNVGELDHLATVGVCELVEVMQGVPPGNDSQVCQLELEVSR